jgi:hypothetical protein
MTSTDVDDLRLLVSFGDDDKTAMCSTTRYQGLVTPP